jgi:hypothetical protein
MFREKGRDSIFILFPEHLQTILFPSLYNYKQSCSLSLYNYTKLVPFSLKNYEQGVQGIALWAHIFLLKTQNSK